MDIDLLAGAIEKALRDRSDEDRRVHTAGYFPTSLEILGVPVPASREVVRDFSGRVAKAPPADLVELALALVKRGTHEGRQVGWELVARRRDAVARLDRPLLERLGAGNDNWASVDGFATYLTGVAWREGFIGDDAIMDWAAAPDLWWRRTALVSTVPLNRKSRGGRGDPGRTFMVCERLAGDREPMVAKAVSWALRDVIAHDRPGVEAFLVEHQERLPALVLREVRRKLETGRKSG